MIYATRYSGKIILFPGMPIAYLMVKDAKCHSQITIWNDYKQCLDTSQNPWKTDFCEWQKNKRVISVKQ